MVKPNQFLKKEDESIELFFEKIFKTYYSPLLIYASKYVSGRAISKDIVQDVFLAIWKNRDNIDFETRPMQPYLYRAVYNKCLNQIKSEKSLLISENVIDYKIGERVLEATPSDSLILKDTTEAINTSIDALPERCKEVFVLSRAHQKNNKEISKMLNISEKAVEKNITNALKRIRDYLYKVKVLP